MCAHEALPHVPTSVIQDTVAGGGMKKEGKTGPEAHNSLLLRGAPWLPQPAWSAHDDILHTDIRGTWSAPENELGQEGQRDDRPAVAITSVWECGWGGLARG